MAVPEGRALFWVESCSQETQASMVTADIATQCTLRLFTSAGSQTDTDLPGTSVNRLKPGACWEESFGSAADTLTEWQRHQNPSCDPDGGGTRQFGDSHERMLNGGKRYAFQSDEQHTLLKWNSSVPEQVHAKKLEVCSVCKKGFRDNTSLLNHMRTHTGEKPFVCRFCPKRYALHYSLVRHERCHTGKNLFVCSACQKQFVTKWDLDCHLRSHSGEKPYACQFCFKRYANRYSVVNHERSHTGERPFVCSICQKRFIRKHNLVHHEVTQHMLMNVRSSNTPL